jgi:hypothetical protein
MRTVQTEGSKPFNDSALLKDEKASLGSPQGGEAKLEDLLCGEDPVLVQIETKLKIPMGGA